MKVKELLEKLKAHDPNDTVIMEIITRSFEEGVRITVQKPVLSVSGRAGGSMDKFDSIFYGVILR